MFYSESDTIVADHPELVEQVRSVDRYFYELAGQTFRLGPASDFLDLEPAALERLLKLYEARDVVEREEISLCPQDGEILEADDTGRLWCDVCEADYGPDECERETAYRARAISVPPPPPEPPHVEATAQIFLCHARKDSAAVENLYRRLSDAGFKPWMDTQDILPGEQWESSIRRAIRNSNFFLACLSKNSVNRRGWIQRELRSALDLWQEKLDSDIYLIPVRLEDCDAPEGLRDFQWVDLFEPDGWTRLVEAIRVGIQRRAE
jgi:hypothetical protein